MPEELPTTEITTNPVAVPPEEIRSALNRILASEPFAKVERPARFLRHLVETTLAGQAPILKESVIGCDVFERAATWDPRLDPVVRQEAARLRKRIAKYYESSGAQDPVRIVLPVGSYVPIFRHNLPAARPPALAEPDVVPPATPEVPAKRKWLPAALALLCAVAVALVVGLVTRTHSPPPPVPIAVLLFANATSDPADDYFGDGVRDEVADSLARFRNVYLVPRSAVAKYGRNPSDLRALSRAEHAAYLLKGSVKRAGDSVEIAASLIRSSDAKPLWTNVYRRHTADLMAIEADLAAAVGATLGLAKPAPGFVHEPSPEAHELYLKGLFEAHQTSVPANARAQQFFREALALDPQYVVAYSGLATAIWNANIWAGRSPVMEERRKAEELWHRALQIDPTFVPAHSGLAAYAMQYDWDWPRAERELLSAMAAGDNLNVEQNYSYLSLIQGKRAEADRHHNRAVELDPEGNGRIANSVIHYLLEGRLAEAETECRKWSSRNPTLAGPKVQLANILGLQGKTAAAVKLLQSLKSASPDAKITLVEVMANASDRHEALRLLAPLEQNYRDGGVMMFDFAVVYAELGDAPTATLWMERSLNAREGPALGIRIDPQLAKVQDYPAFRALKKRMNLDW